MYEVSRSLYRTVMPQATASGAEGERASQFVLDACEETFHRIETEPHFAHPDRFLFGRVRRCFPITVQADVRRAIELHVEMARRLIALRPKPNRECHASTRRGSRPCKREAVAGSLFCPSHRHLEAAAPEEPRAQAAHS
jgi:hypothetical protein